MTTTTSSDQPVDGETSGTRFRFQWVAAFHDGLKVLAESRHDICLVDYCLGNQRAQLTRQANLPATPSR